MEAKVYNQTGKEAGKVKLPEEIFDVKWNADLVHQVVTSMQADARTPVAHTKDRSEVRGGGAKPWRQKGTGRARHGSNRSPIWVGGGVTFGPRNEKSYAKKVNKKMKNKALSTVLSQKLRDQEVLFVDNLTFAEPKTKEAKGVIDALAGIKGYEGLSTKKKNAALVVTDEKSESRVKSFSNFGNIKIEEVRNLNILDTLKYKYLVIESPDKSLEVIKGRNK